MQVDKASWNVVTQLERSFVGANPSVPILEANNVP